MKAMVQEDVNAVAGLMCGEIHEVDVYGCDHPTDAQKRVLEDLYDAADVDDIGYEVDLLRVNVQRKAPGIDRVTVYRSQFMAGRERP